jgi:hypothetical protein
LKTTTFENSGVESKGLIKPGLSRFRKWIKSRLVIVAAKTLSTRFFEAAAVDTREGTILSLFERVLETRLSTA